jgi:KaiC/GvpD/RAD55 family RecA-like ATPase
LASDITKSLKKILKGEDVFSMDDEKNPYTITDFIDTGCYILNACIGNGDIFGGMPKGKRVAFAGPSSTGKSLLTAHVAKSYLKEIEGAHLIAFETEGASFFDMMNSIDIDKDRVTIIPTATVEKFKINITKLLKAITEERAKGVHNEYIFLLDSLGMLATEKETADAIDGKVVGDMTRAKTIRSIFRIISLDLFRLQIPFLLVNHTYETMSMYGGPEMSGGGGVKYAADVIIMLTKAKEKEGTAHIGAILSLNVAKSRFIPENVKGKVFCLFKKGIMKHSYLLEVGLELGIIHKEGISYVLNGIKKRKNDIMKNPEAYYTPEALEILRQGIMKAWCFGQGDEDVDMADLANCDLDAIDIEDED